MRKQREIAQMSERQTREYEEMAERVDKEVRGVLYTTSSVYCAVRFADPFVCYRVLRL